MQYLLLSSDFFVSEAHPAAEEERPRGNLASNVNKAIEINRRRQSAWLHLVYTVIPGGETPLPHCYWVSPFGLK